MVIMNMSTIRIISLGSSSMVTSPSPDISDQDDGESTCIHVVTQLILFLQNKVLLFLINIRFLLGNYERHHDQTYQYRKISPPSHHHRLQPHPHHPYPDPHYGYDKHPHKCSWQTYQEPINDSCQFKLQCSTKYMSCFIFLIP